MAGAPIRNKASSEVTGATAGDTLPVTFTESSLLSNAYGLIAQVRRRVSSGAVDISLATPAGWTLLRNKLATNGTITVGEWVFTKLGDGATNGITIANPTSVTSRILLTAWLLDEVVDPFCYGVVDTSGNPATTETLALAASPKHNSVAVASVAISGTPGGSGYAFSEGTLIKSTGASDNFNLVYTAAVEPPAAKTVTNTWTTATIMAGIAFWVSGVSPLITEASTNTDDIYEIDRRASTTNSGGTLSYSISPTTDVVEIVEGFFLVKKYTTPRTMTITTTDSGAASPRTSTVTVPAIGSGLEKMVKSGGILI